MIDEFSNLVARILVFRFTIKGNQGVSFCIKVYSILLIECNAIKINYLETFKNEKGLSIS